MADSTPAAGDFDKNNAEGTSEMKTKNAGDMSGSGNDAICPGYNAEAKFSLTFSVDSLDEKPKTESVLVGNHLMWYLYAEQTTNKDEDFLSTFLINEDWYKYPMSYDLEYTLEANDIKDRIVQKESFDFGAPNYKLFGGWMIAYDQLLSERDKFEVDGKLTVTATLTIRMPTCYNFNAANRLSDVTIKIAQRAFPASRALLALHSNYFDRMFSGKFAEAKQDEVVLDHVDAGTFVIAVNLILVRSFKINMNFVAPVLQLADHFQMLLLLEHCEELLMNYALQSEPGLAERLVLATKYSLNKLQKRCLELCNSVKIINDVRTSPFYKDLPAETKLLLFDRVLEVAPK